MFPRLARTPAFLPYLAMATLLIPNAPPTRGQLRVLEGTGSDGAADPAAKPGDVNTRNLDLASGNAGGSGAVAGRVLGVTLGDATEVPLAGADVGVFSGENLLGSAITDQDGFYSIDELPPGELGLFATAQGFDIQFVRVFVEANRVAEQLVLLGSLQACQNCPFQNVTVDAGLDGYRASTGDGHGPGGVFADLNDDGYPELYLMRAAGHGGTGPSANQLYVNVAGPSATRQYVEAPQGAGAGDTGNATGAIAGDYDNDGDLDLYVLNFDQPNALLQNQWADTGVLEFVDVTADTDPTPVLPDDQFGVGISFFDGIALDNSLTAAWADVDRDGDLDLYVGNHNGFFNTPIEGPFSIPGRRDVFYLNNGDGTFTDVTMAAGVPGYISENGLFQTANQRFSSTNGVIFADFNNDRWPDLLVTNKIGGPDDRDMLYLNLGAGPEGIWQGFATVTYDLSPPFGFASGAAMGVDAADVDNDGDIDIYITDWNSGPGAPGPNDLWVNQLSETGTLSFVLSRGAPASFSWGTQWQDFDNDGRVDLHVATEGGHRDFLYLNSVTGAAEAAIPLGVAQIRNTRGDLAADYNRDGWVDLFLVNLDGGPSVLYQNELSLTQALPNHYLVVKLVGDPLMGETFHSTRDAIGARVRLIADLEADGVGCNEIQLREVMSGNSNAGSTSSLELEFGIGQAPSAVIIIDWPSGRRSVMPAQPDQFLIVAEGTAVAADFDGDGDVDGDDLNKFVVCFTGPGGGPTGAQCAPGDVDGDGDVDCSDWDLFELAWTGPGNPPAFPPCATERLFGDVDQNGTVNIFDLLCVLQGFSGNFSACSLEDVDLAPCAGNGTIDIFDLLAVLNGFAGIDPCCGT